MDGEGWGGGGGGYDYTFPHTCFKELDDFCSLLRSGWNLVCFF